MRNMPLVSMAVKLPSAEGARGRQHAAPAYARGARKYARAGDANRARGIRGL